MQTFNYKTITIHQKWSSAYDDWNATQVEKRSFKTQFMMIQSEKITFENPRNIDSYFCQIKNGFKAISADADKFANEFFGLNRKNQ